MMKSQWKKAEFYSMAAVLLWGYFYQNGVDWNIAVQIELIMIPARCNPRV